MTTRDVIGDPSSAVETAVEKVRQREGKIWPYRTYPIVRVHEARLPKGLCVTVPLYGTDDQNQTGIQNNPFPQY